MNCGQLLCRTRWSRRERQSAGDWPGARYALPPASQATLDPQFGLVEPSNPDGLMMQKTLKSKADVIAFSRG